MGGKHLASIYYAISFIICDASMADIWRKQWRKTKARLLFVYIYRDTDKRIVKWIALQITTGKILEVHNRPTSRKASRNQKIHEMKANLMATLILGDVM